MNPLCPYKYLFFDLDNTLWDFDANAQVALQNLYEHCHLDQYFTSFEEYYIHYSGCNARLWELYGAGKITKDYLNQERFQYPLRTAGAPLELAPYMEEHYLPLLAQQTRLKPHCLEVLNRLHHAGYELYLISNGFAEIQQVKLERSHLLPYFKKIYLSEQVGAHKPSPIFFDYMLKSSNARKKESLVIGDNFDADIAGARNYKIDQVYVDFNSPVDAPLEAAKEVGEERTGTLTIKKPFEPTYTIHDLTEILAIVKCS